VAWRITDHKDLLSAVNSPVLLECLVEAALHVFWEVGTAISLCLSDKGFDCTNILGEGLNSESLCIPDVSVSDKANSDSESFVLSFDVVDDLL
jgi:hypothetical protein